MQPDDVSRLFDEWAARLARGERPDPETYLAEAGENADELSRLMQAFLVAAPRRKPDEQSIEAMRAWAAGESPLVALRVRRGLRRDDLVDAVMTEFKLPMEKRSVVKRYVHRLEAGLIDPRRLSGPLLALLQTTLHASASTILAARVRPLKATPAFRETGVKRLAAASETSERDEEDPQIAELFLSGR